jgi:hypothetical protein
MDPCIFCPNPADSKEDLFPRWILKRVRTRVPLYRQMGDDAPELTDDQEVRIPCVCQTCNNRWMSGMETTVARIMGPMIEDLSFPLDRQNQQNLAEWAVKGAMVNDTVDAHRRLRFFKEAECHEFRQTRRIPDGTTVFVAQYNGRSLDSHGVDFTLIEPEANTLLVRGHVYNVMVGHVVLQVLSWHPEPQHENKFLQVRAKPGPWKRLATQIWPIAAKSVDWPPPLSLSTRNDHTHYLYFRERFKSDAGHRLITPKADATSGRLHPAG